MQHTPGGVAFDNRPASAPFADTQQPPDTYHAAQVNARIALEASERVPEEAAALERGPHSLVAAPPLLALRSRPHPPHASCTDRACWVADSPCRAPLGDVQAPELACTSPLDLLRGGGAAAARLHPFGALVVRVPPSVVLVGAHVGAFVAHCCVQCAAAP